jgi:hypothetical protein
MTHTVASQYYVRAIDPSSGEVVAFACPDMAMANAKVAELRGRYQEVVMSKLLEQELPSH